MHTLIIKLGATGDVVRTSTLLNRLCPGVTWVTAAKNLSYVDGLNGVRALTWEGREAALDTRYDLIINLEDTEDTAAFGGTAHRGDDSTRVFGAQMGADGRLGYSDDARGWFDLSLISRFGRERADQLKLENRRTYQDLVFDGLGLEFKGDAYVLPKAVDTGLRGDVAISPVAGAVWPMKAWAYYGELQRELGGARINSERAANAGDPPGAFGRRARPPVPGERRQPADAPRASERGAVRLDLQLHQPLGDPRLRFDDEIGVAAA